MTDTETTIPLVRDEDAPAGVAELFTQLQQGLGFVPNYFRMVAHAPDYAGAILGLEGAVTGKGSLAQDLKELIMLRVSELNGCPYCTSWHRGSGAAAGLSEAKRAAVASRELDRAPFSADELAALQLAEEMTLEVRARPETVADLRARVGDRATVELMTVAALLNFHNRMAWTANLPVDPQLSGP